MIPILYDKYETDFLSNGLGQLGDCLSCTVTEEINGIYEVEFTYPITGVYYEQLINFGGVVACTHDHNGDVQLFDIYKYTAPIDGIVTFYGRHVAYRLDNFIFLNLFSLDTPVSMRNPAELFYGWNNGWGVVSYSQIRNFHFTDYTNYPPSQISEVLLGGSECSLWEGMRDTSGEKKIFERRKALCVEQLWKGEWEFDRFNVNYYINRGVDRGVQIRFGKNMVGVERERNWGDTVSVLYPIWSIAGEAESYNPVISPKVESATSPWQTLENGIAEQMYSDSSPLYLRPAQYAAKVINLAQKFSTQPTQAQVNEYCLDYMSKNSTWRADDNITVEFLDLYGTPEYENIQGLTDCRLGDFVSILYPQLGIVSNGVEIMSLTYDVLAERVTQMQLNTIRTTLAQAIIDSIGGT